MTTTRAKRIALAGLKGGIGKTTIAIHLAVALARRGARTLLLDLDPQGGVDLYFASTRMTGLADYLMDRIPISHALKRTPFDGLRLIGRGKLDPVDSPNFERALAHTPAVGELLDLLDGQFDYIIMDLPCGFGSVTRTALKSAQQVLVPVVGEPMSVRSITQACRVVEWIRDNQNPELDLLGLISTMLDPDAFPGDAELRSVWFGFASNLDTAVPKSRWLVESSRRRRPLHLLERAPADLIACFDRLGDEVVRRTDPLTVALDAQGGESKPNVKCVIERLRACAPNSDQINEEFSSFAAPTTSHDPEKAAVEQAKQAVEAATHVLERLCNEESFGFRSWRELLDWCRKMTGSDSVFAMDHQGLVIADDGKLQAKEVEDTGTRLILAFDQASKMRIADGRAQIISIQLGSRWLTGIRIGTDGEAAFTIGLLGQQPAGESERRGIENVLGVVAERYYSFSAN